MWHSLLKPQITFQSHEICYVITLENFKLLSESIELSNIQENNKVIKNSIYFCIWHEQIAFDLSSHSEEDNKKTISCST